MSTAVLLMKLIEVERALQSGNIYGAHRLVLESEEFVLKLEREMIQVQTEKLGDLSRIQCIRWRLFRRK